MSRGCGSGARQGATARAARAGLYYVQNVRSSSRRRVRHDSAMGEVRARGGSFDYRDQKHTALQEARALPAAILSYRHHAVSYRHHAACVSYRHHVELDWSRTTRFRRPVETEEALRHCKAGKDQGWPSPAATMPSPRRRQDSRHGPVAMETSPSSPTAAGRGLRGCRCGGCCAGRA